MSVIEQLEHKLSGPVFRNENGPQVRDALDSLVGNGASLFREYCERFRGPIGSDICAFELLDTIEEEPTIISSTRYFRDAFGLGDQWVVLSTVVGGAVLIYDAARDVVFNVDFEGGLDLLLQDKLHPIANSFEGFLRWFFELPTTRSGPLSSDP